MEFPPLSSHPLVAFASKYFWKGNVLDVGCGSGENAVSLAAKGFSVTALDNSPVFIHSTEQLSKIYRVPVKIVLRDIREFAYPTNYDVMLCTEVLHFLNLDDRKEIIKEMQEYTSKGGVHVISAFLISSGRRWTRALNEGELRELYKDWEMLAYGEHDGVVEMVARKR
jgi:tellurite methyltransferase